MQQRPRVSRARCVSPSGISPRPPQPFSVYYPDTLTSALPFLPAFHARACRPASPDRIINHGDILNTANISGQDFAFGNGETINGSLSHRVRRESPHRKFIVAARALTVSVKIFMQRRYVDCIKSNPESLLESCSNIHALACGRGTSLKSATRAHGDSAKFAYFGELSDPDDPRRPISISLRETKFPFAHRRNAN